MRTAKPVPTTLLICSLTLFGLTLFGAGAAPAATDTTGQPSAWIGLPGLEPSTFDRLVRELDLRGTYGDLTIALGTDDTLAVVRERVPSAFFIGAARAGERLVVVYLGPDQRLLSPSGSRVLHRTAARAIMALPLGTTLSPEQLVEPLRAYFHDGIAPVPSRRQRPQRPPLERFRSDGGSAIDPVDPRIQAWVDRVSKLNLESSVTTLSTQFHTRRSDTQDGRDAQNWLRDQFDGFGLVTSLHDFDGGADNVIAEIPGALEPEKVVIVGAHYDSISYSGSRAPGADDNASGTAALLEIARILASEGATFRYTIRFICFASEEFGLIGSDAYSRLMLNQQVDVVAMLNTDMSAYRKSGDALDLDMVTNDTTPWLTDLVIAIANLYVPDLPTGRGTLHGGTSDHLPFYLDGFPAVFYFEDTSDYSPYIHSDFDIVGTSANDFDLSQQIVKSVLAGAAVLAEPAGGGVAPELAVTGTCPGTVTVEISGAASQESVALAASDLPGLFVVPGGPCLGTELDLATPWLLALMLSDADGSVTFDRTVSEGACDLSLQAVDMSSCQSSNVAQMP